MRSRLPNTDIDIGRISVKVHFSDGTDIQVLPSFPVRNGYKIPRYQGDSWSGVIRPREFARSLTEVNRSNAGNVVKAIKLYKIANDKLPEHGRLQGYHIEAIAIRAFQNYTGPLELREMFMHLCRAASEQVKSPMVETTGQSAYIDNDLGAAGSTGRLKTSDTINRMVQRLEIANSQCQLDAWNEVFK